MLPDTSALLPVRLLARIAHVHWQGKQNAWQRDGMDGDGETYNYGEVWNTSFKIFEETIEDEVYDSEAKDDSEHEDGEDEDGEDGAEGEEERPQH